jgi:hypothetical protein
LFPKTAIPLSEAKLPTPTSPQTDSFDPYRDFFIERDEPPIMRESTDRIDPIRTSSNIDVFDPIVHAFPTLSLPLDKLSAKTSSELVRMISEIDTRFKSALLRTDNDPRQPFPCVDVPEEKMPVDVPTDKWPLTTTDSLSDVEDRTFADLQTIFSPIETDWSKQALPWKEVFPLTDRDDRIVELENMSNGPTKVVDWWIDNFPFKKLKQETDKEPFKTESPLTEICFPKTPPPTPNEKAEPQTLLLETVEPINREFLTDNEDPPWIFSFTDREDPARVFPFIEITFTHTFPEWTDNPYSILRLFPRDNDPSTQFAGPWTWISLPISHVDVILAE